MIITDTTRRAALKLAGGALAAPLFWSSRTSAHLRTTVSVGDFGARGDGRSDDREAFQAAVNHLHALGGGRLLVPAVDTARGRYYRLTLPFSLRSGVTIKGEGPGSLLFNDREQSVLFGDSFVVLPGNYHPAYTQHLPFVPCGRVAQGSRSVTLNRAADIREFPPGTTVALRTRAMTMTFDGFEDLLWQRLNEVVASEPGNPILELNYPIDRTIGEGLEIAATDTDRVRMTARPEGLAGAPMFVAKRAGIHNLAMRSNGAVMGDTATLECTFTDLWITGYRGIYGNLFCHSRFERIRLNVGIQIIEASQNSHDTVFRNIVGRVSEWGGENFQLVTFNESAARLTLDGFRIEAGPWAAHAPALRFGPHSEDCVIRNGFLSAPNARGGMVAMEVGHVAPGEDQRITSNCAFENIVCEGGTASSNALICEVADSAFLIDCRFENLSFSGEYLRAGRIDGTRTQVTNCRWSGEEAQLQVLPGATDCRIVDNEIAGGIELTAPDLNDRNVIIENRTG